MVFGGIQHERLQLNEDMLWSGVPRIWNNARASLVLPEVHRLIFEERYAEANTLAKQMQYYSASDLDRLERVDSLFPMNNLRHPSKGKRCLTGESVISADGDGTIRRCHFIRENIGNIYMDNWEAPLLCTNETCGCHIDYVHMPDLALNAIFGNGILERIPTGVLRTKKSL